MPFRDQPADLACAPLSYREPDYERSAGVTPLTEGGCMVWQEPDQLAIFQNREAFMQAREQATVYVPP